jgi:spore cortex formation protein SpoVR/YcgB (stage V sporulation)
MSLFEKAAKQKLRFNSNKGQLTVEDLFDLSLTSLDNIAKAVNRKLKDEVEESFIQKKSTASTELELQLDILKYIIEYKTNVEEANKKRAETVARKHQIEEILMRKKSQELEDLSVDELQAMLNG